MQPSLANTRSYFLQRAHYKKQLFSWEQKLDRSWIFEYWESFFVYSTPHDLQDISIYGHHFTPLLKASDNDNSDVFFRLLFAFSLYCTLYSTRVEFNYVHNLMN